MIAGSTTVALEARFAALVSDEDYHVFVSPEGDRKGLYVASRSREGFVVRECQDGTSDVAFSYRLAIRRTDIDNKRFKSVELPDGPSSLPLRKQPGVQKAFYNGQNRSGLAASRLRPN